LAAGSAPRLQGPHSSRSRQCWEPGDTTRTTCAERLRHAEENTLTFIGEGNPGSYAYIDVSDSLPRKPKLLTAQEAGTWGRLLSEAGQ
jgi:hypothetical protein